MPGRDPDARALVAALPGAAVDYLLVNELFKNQDVFEASTFMTGARGKLQLGPVWDFDFSSGNSKRAPSRFLEGWTAAARPWAERLYADRPHGTHAGHSRELRRWLDRRIDWLDRNL